MNHTTDTVKATYDNLMKQSKRLVERQVEHPEHYPTEDQYAVLHMSLESQGKRNGDHSQDLSLTQLGVFRFISVVSQIVSGWGGELIETNLNAYTAIFPMSEPDATSRSCICGMQILNAITNVIQPSLREEGIEMSFHCGIGISMGSVFGFQTGLQAPMNRLYYGDAISSAVEYANMSSGVVIVDRLIKEQIERSETGFKVQFQPYRYHEWVGYQFKVG
ncbi:nucleotidyl cyclase domain-containing protein [Cohnella cholangitidis]|uniref:Adenylate/guanylate cyclase domain-containing protein n=1 Tax=Cohnella cholangitidis TaxID=2598458 RepID=A0A7G5BSI2_9BACL|nr:hypothetical protein [Cohnella cholangitidis]QMV39916.1 hypothetical protein FPL14_00865 [Cohnella cholangitidis]